MKKNEIFTYVKNLLDYDDNNVIRNSYEISQKLAFELGFSTQIANIINNCILFIDHSGDKEKDASKISIKIKESIWS